MNLREFTREQLREALSDASKKLAFVRDTVKNMPEAHIPFPRLSEIDFLESRIREYRGELSRRWAEDIPAHIFYSYSKRDKLLLAELDSSLSSLKSERVIETFWDRHIDPGIEWHTKISEQLSNADLILLLVSPDFLASRYCQKVELPASLDLHAWGLARVVPILLRPCEWRNTLLARFQAIPHDCKPVIEWPDRAGAWAEVVKSICDLVDQMRHATI